VHLPWVLLCETRVEDVCKLWRERKDDPGPGAWDLNPSPFETLGKDAINNASFPQISE